MVDDAGRLLDVCDIGDDPYGYAYLSTLLAERASGPYSVAIAADNDQRLVPALLATAGWALAFVDDDSTDDFAERFAEELSEEVESAPIQRRALGLARALHAGALSTTSVPAPVELSGLKPVLAAHGALATGRHAAAVALREVLRELYPAALRAYPDPADPVALAVMDALPEPGALTSSTAGRSRDTAAAVDAVTSQLAASGLGDQADVTEAITALRVAIAETPRRGGISKGLTATVAETVRQSVAAVRACDAASTILVKALADRVTSPVSRAQAPSAAAAPVPAASPAPANLPGGPGAARASIPPRPAAAPAPVSRTPIPAHRAPVAPPTSPAPVSPAMPVAASASPPAPQSAPTPPHPVSPQPAAAPPAAMPPPAPSPVSPPPVAPPPMAPPPVAPAPMAPPPMGPRSAHTAATPPAHAAAPPAPPLPSRAATDRGEPTRWSEYGTNPGSRRPVSVPPPPPPGITPIAEPRSPAPAPGAGASWDQPGGSTEGQDLVRVPTPRPPQWDGSGSHAAPPSSRSGSGMAPGPPPGSRSDWPTSSPTDPRATPRRPAPPADPLRPAPPADPLRPAPPADPLRPAPPADPLPSAYQPSYEPPAEPRQSGGRRRAQPPRTEPVTPPWRADDLRPPEPPEPPALRLVEPTLPEELRDDLGYPGRPEPPPLRLVEPPGNGIPRSVPPVSADDDDTLLIFAQTRSAWFTGENGETEWSSPLDVGWQAAEQAAREPTVGERTGAGLPRRVPRANLVPGSPPPTNDRQLRVVRDPASIAAHTSGYFNGWRRGQEVGGYPLGGRQQAAGAWDFSRDDERLSG